MGSGLSCAVPSFAIAENSGSAGNPFINETIQHGFQQLFEDINARKSFANYVKSGLWYDGLEKYEQKISGIICAEDSVARLNDWKNAGYAVPEQTITKEMSSKSSLRTNSSSRITEGSANSSKNSKKTESLLYVDGEICFSIEDLSIVLLIALYPIYEQSNHYRHFLETRESSESNDDFVEYNGSEIDVSRAQSTVDGPPSRSDRVRSILVSIAAHYDLDDFVDLMGRPNIVNSFVSILHNCPYPITLSDTNKATTKFPIVYSNDAMRKVTGYGTSYFMNSDCGDLSTQSSNCASPDDRDLAKILFGRDSEPQQVKHIRDALHSAKATKAAVTCHKRNGARFMNMMATLPLSPVNKLHECRYMLAIHYDYTPRNTFGRQLQDVEDLLSLCSVLLGCRETALPSAQAATAAAASPPTSGTVLTRISSCRQLFRQLSGIPPIQEPLNSNTPSSVASLKKCRSFVHTPKRLTAYTLSADAATGFTVTPIAGSTHGSGKSKTSSFALKRFFPASPVSSPITTSDSGATSSYEVKKQQQKHADTDRRGSDMSIDTLSVCNTELLE